MSELFDFIIHIGSGIAEYIIKIKTLAVMPGL
jgi:hypothetical protein